MTSTDKTASCFSLKQHRLVNRPLIGLLPVLGNLPLVALPGRRNGWEWRIAMEVGYWTPDRLSERYHIDCWNPKRKYAFSLVLHFINDAECDLPLFGRASSSYSINEKGFLSVTRVPTPAFFVFTKTSLLAHENPSDPFMCFDGFSACSKSLSAWYL